MSDGVAAAGLPVAHRSFPDRGRAPHRVYDWEGDMISDRGWLPRLRADRWTDRDLRGWLRRERLSVQIACDVDHPCGYWLNSPTVQNGVNDGRNLTPFRRAGSTANSDWRRNTFGQEDASAKLRICVGVARSSVLRGRLLMRSSTRRRSSTV